MDRDTYANSRGYTESNGVVETRVRCWGGKFKIGCCSTRWGFFFACRRARNGSSNGYNDQRGCDGCRVVYHSHLNAEESAANSMQHIQFLCPTARYRIWFEGGWEVGQWEVDRFLVFGVDPLTTINFKAFTRIKLEVSSCQ